jgi:ABC-type transport system involved in multi-copper enzyme maturation permease subunit
MLLEAVLLTRSRIMELNSPRLLGYWTGLTRCGSAACRLVRQWRPADLVGPLFFYDLVRLARRGRSILLRCIYALTLLAALCFAYANHFAGHQLWQEAFAPRAQVPRHELADFSRLFILAVLLAQSAAVLAITPIYLAGAIAEEKERHTLVLLFGSHLSDREIILGKLFARLTHLGSVLLTGLPIVLVASLLGGGDNLVVLLATFLVTAMTLLSAGSISMLCSVLCRNAMNALMASYGCLLAFNLLWIVPSLGYLSSPVAFEFILDNRLHELSQPLASAPRPTVLAGQAMISVARPPALTLQAMSVKFIPMTTAYVLLHGLIAVLCIWAAIEFLRRAEPDPVFHTPTAKPRLVPVSTVFDMPEKPSPHPVRPARKLSLLPPPIGDALLWKEMVHDPPKQIPAAPEVIKGIALQVLFLCGAFWLTVLGYWCYLHEDAEDLIVVDNFLVRVLGMAAAFGWCIGVAFRAASSLGRERDRRTLGLLLTLPVERVAILRAKWLGSILRLRTLGLLLLGIWSLGLLTGTLHPLGVLHLAGSCAAWLGLLASLGLWLALGCRNTKRAQLSLVLILLLLFASQLISMTDPNPFSTDPEETWVHLWQVGLNPFASWWVAGFSWREWREALSEDLALFAARLVAVVHGIAVLFALTGLFCLAARRRLDREPCD